MPQSNPRDRLAHWVHWTLLAGVTISGSLLCVGLAILFLRHEPRPAGPPPGLSALVAAAMTGSGLSIIQLSLLLLMATPIVRVAMLAVGWAIERDWRFAGIALMVLSLLGLSIAMGIR